MKSTLISAYSFYLKKKTLLKCTSSALGMDSPVTGHGGPALPSTGLTTAHLLHHHYKHETQTWHLKLSYYANLISFYFLTCFKVFAPQKSTPAFSTVASRGRLQNRHLIQVFTVKFNKLEPQKRTLSIHVHYTRPKT